MGLSEWITLVASLTMGLVMGLFYFGGLWLTLQSMDRYRHPARLTMGSLAFRLGVMLVSLYLISGGDPVRIGLWLFGFLLGRTLLVRWISSQKPLQEGS